MKKLSIVFILLLILFSLNVSARNFELGVGSAILVSAESGQVLYRSNAEQKYPPASLAKIMTLLVTMEKIDNGDINLEDYVTISENAESTGGSQIYLSSGSRVKLKNLLKAISISSANDASVAVAEYVAGSEGKFVDLMNMKAKNLGMKNTHFANSSGLPSEYEEQYTTADDVVLMAQELIKYPIVVEWTSTWVDYLNLPSHRAMLVNTNELVKRGYINGLKTGYLQEAGYSLAANASKEGKRLISVVMGAPSEEKRELATLNLLDYGFNNFQSKVVVEAGEKVHNIEIENGAQNYFTAQAEKDIRRLTIYGEPLEEEIKIKDGLKAPIEKGEVIGKKIIKQGDFKVAEVSLVASQRVDKAGIFTILWRKWVNFVGENIVKRFKRNVAQEIES